MNPLVIENGRLFRNYDLCNESTLTDDGSSSQGNIDIPEKVKEYISQKIATNGYKENLAGIHDRYVGYNDLTWQHPYYIRPEWLQAHRTRPYSQL